ncbi:MAG: universal stress protein [Thiotrichales bacterium]
MSKLPTYQTILYATDLSDHTRPVFRHAVSLARTFGGSIVMLHVMEPLGPTSHAVLNAYLPNVDLQTLERDCLKDVALTMKRRLEKFCEEEGESCTDDSPLVRKIRVVTGQLSEQILKAASEVQASLIVIGTGAHALLGQHTIGTTARKVSQYTRIPVLLVPND